MDISDINILGDIKQQLLSFLNREYDSTHGIIHYKIQYVHDL